MPQRTARDVIVKWGQEGACTMTKTPNRSAFAGLGLRMLVLALLLVGVSAGAAVNLWLVLMPVALAGLIYAKARPQGQGDFRLAPVSAIILPDWLGFTLTTLFLALPVWATYGTPSALGLHPSAFVLWPMALASTAFLYIGWQSESFALSLGDQALILRRGLWCYHLPYDQITRAQPWQRDLPRWMRATVPLLLALRQPGPAGALMLARKRRGIKLVSDHGQSGLVIETDGLIPSAPKLIAALSGKGVDTTALSDRPVQHRLTQARSVCPVHFASAPWRKMSPGSPQCNRATIGNALSTFYPRGNFLRMGKLAPTSP